MNSIRIKDFGTSMCMVLMRSTKEIKQVLLLNSLNKFKNMVRSKFLEEKPAETSSMLRMFVKFIIGCFIMMTLGSLMLALVILFLLGILLTKWQRILEQKLSK